MDSLPHVLHKDRNVEDIATFTSELKRVCLGVGCGDVTEVDATPEGCGLASRSRVVSGGCRVAAHVSRFFEGVVCDWVMRVVIILDVFCLGYAANGAAANPDLEASDFVTGIGVAFNVFYALELSGKLASNPFRFFVGPDCRWNWFDSATVFFSVYDFFAPNISSVVGPT